MECKTCKNLNKLSEEDQKKHVRECVEVQLIVAKAKQSWVNLATKTA